MKTMAEIAEARSAAVELALDALRQIMPALPVAPPEDLEACALALKLQALQLMAVAGELRERQRFSKPAPAWMQ